MNYFEELEGKDPLDFTSRSKKQTKKQKTGNKLKKPRNESCTGAAIGCIGWVVIIALVWGYFSKSTHEKPVNTPQVTERHYSSFREINDDDRQIIGDFARFVKEQKEIYISFRNTREFREDGFSRPEFNNWLETIQERRRTDIVPTYGSGIMEYADVETGAVELIAIAFEAYNPRKPDYNKKEETVFMEIDEAIAPYLEWGNTNQSVKKRKTNPIDEAKNLNIKKHAKNIWDLHTQYIYLTHSLEFQQQGIKSEQYKKWLGKVKNGMSNLDQDFGEDHCKEYVDLQNAYTELKNIARAFALRQPDYDEKEKTSFEIIKKCQKYQTL